MASNVTWLLNYEGGKKVKIIIPNPNHHCKHNPNNDTQTN